MPDKTWKAINRDICKLLGGRRAGYDGDGGADCAGTDPYAVEVKHRKKLPDWLEDGMLQAQLGGAHTDLPLLVLHEERQPIKSSYVVMRIGDFVDWFVSRREEDSDE